MERPKKKDFRPPSFEINCGQDVADWYGRLIKAQEKYIDHLESKDDWISVEDFHKIKWSENEANLRIQVQTVFELLGLSELPQTEKELTLFDKFFEGYPHKLDPNEVDFEAIWNNVDSPPKPNK